MKTYQIAILCLLFVGSSVAAQNKPLPWFMGTMNEAMELAAKRNVPILAAFIQDNEEANDRVVEGLYNDAEFRLLLDRVVPVLASPGTHKPKKGTGDTQVCSKFGHAPCAHHRKMEMDARGYCWANAVKTPSHVLLDPEGVVIGRLIDVHSVSTFTQLVTKGETKLGAGVRHSEFRRVHAAFKEAERLIAGFDLMPARLALDSVTELLKTEELKETAETLFKSLDTRAADVVDYAKQLLSQSRAVEAGSALKGAMEAMKGREGEAALKAAYKDFLSTDAGKAAKKILALEGRLKPTLERAASRFEGSRPKLAVKAYFEIMSKVPGTQLAKTARERLDALKTQHALALDSVVREGEAKLLYSEARRLHEPDSQSYKEALQAIVQEYEDTRVAKKVQKELNKK